MSGKGGKRSTSYGEIKGNQPGASGAHGKGGAKPKTFEGRMRAIADRAAEAKRWERLTADDNLDHDLFFKAFDRAADRGYGKSGQPITGTIELTVVIRDESAHE